MRLFLRYVRHSKYFEDDKIAKLHRALKRRMQDDSVLNEDPIVTAVFVGNGLEDCDRLFPF